MIQVFVDEVAVEVRVGATLLDAVRAAGQSVPTLCNDDRLIRVLTPGLIYVYSYV